MNHALTTTMFMNTVIFAACDTHHETSFTHRQLPFYTYALKSAIIQLISKASGGIITIFLLKTSEQFKLHHSLATLSKLCTKFIEELLLRYTFPWL